MRILKMLTLAGCCLCLAACRIPLSEKPLSDASNSRVDERLLGVWEIDLRPLHEKFDTKPSDNSVTYVIERTTDKPHALACTQLEEGKPKREAFPLLTTHLGMRDFLSLGDNGDGQRPFAICMYQFEDEDHGTLYLMDDSFVVNQIDNGKIAGKVDREDGSVRGILLKADTKALREMVTRHGDDVFDMKHGLPCRRIKPSITKD